MFEGLDVSVSCKEKIESAVKNGRLSHALILEGADSETRLSAAKELAKAIVCTGESKPCGTCRACRKIDADSHPDVHYLFKDEKSTMIKVDEVRVLRQKAKLLPNDGDKSVFIIHEAQFMNAQAQNALLKIFEEPAPFVSFILTCNAKSIFLDTIVSRASSYFLSGEESVSYEKENAQALEKAAELTEALCRKTEFDFLLLTAVFQKDKELFKNTLEALVLIFRDALIVKNGRRAPLLTEKQQEAKMLSDTFTEKQLLEYLNKTKMLANDAVSSANHNLLTTRLCSVFFDIKIN